MTAPDVSVVMSVFNEAATLVATLESVLSQRGCSLEFIVVNDGSTDASASILDERARRDSRLIVVHQPNAGLTRSLRTGCAMARGEFIARQDAGDVSLPQRLAEQIRLLRSDAGCAAVTCQVEFVGPEGEFLYRTHIAEDELNRRLANPAAGIMGPPHHGSVTMRKSVYELAGGYRECFYFAQDIDLWTRLVEHGRFAVLGDVLYRAHVQANSITGTHAAEQQRLAHIITEATLARRSGASEEECLQRAAAVRKVAGSAKRRRLAHGNYFIGSCLLAADPRRAQKYFGAALSQDPLHWRAMVRWLQAMMRS